MPPRGAALPVQPPEVGQNSSAQVGQNPLSQPKATPFLTEHYQLGGELVANLLLFFQPFVLNGKKLFCKRQHFRIIASSADG